MLRHAMIGLYQILQCCQEIDNLEFINRQRSLLRTPYNWHNIISEQSWVFHLQVISTRKKRQFMGLVKRVGTTPLHFKFVIDCFEAMAHQATYCNLDCTNFMDIHMIGFVDDSNGQVKNSFLWDKSSDRLKRLIHMIGFVDDSNGQVNSFLWDKSSDRLKRLIHKAEYNAIAWSNLLSATGGSLELSKCSYHVANWQFSMRGAPVLGSVKSRVPAISVTNLITGDSQTLEYLSPSVAHKMLGHQKEPTGTQVAKCWHLKEERDKVTELLWTTDLSRQQEAWTFFMRVICPALHTRWQVPI